MPYEVSRFCPQRFRGIYQLVKPESESTGIKQYASLPSSGKSLSIKVIALAVFGFIWAVPTGSRRR